ncbi:MAG: hypothetical protein ACLTRS_12070 [Lachnospiraceae bacterium]
MFESSASLASASQSYTVTNEMLTAAFASIANDGIYQKPTYYTKVLDRQGNILLESVPSQTRIIKKFLCCSFNKCNGGCDFI